MCQQMWLCGRTRLVDKRQSWITAQVYDAGGVDVHVVVGGHSECGLQPEGLSIVLGRILLLKAVQVESLLGSVLRLAPITVGA